LPRGLAIPLFGWKESEEESMRRGRESREGDPGNLPTSQGWLSERDRARKREKSRLMEGEGGVLNY